MDSATTTAPGDDVSAGKTKSSPPARYIYTEADMDAFRSSPIKTELLSFVTAMGRSCSSSTYRYDPTQPLTGLSPGMASLHGSLRHMAEQWLLEIPPDEQVKARFGNPSFREWHARLVQRSRPMIQSVLDCHKEHVVNARKMEGATTDHSETFSTDTLQACADAGYHAASVSDNKPTEDPKEEEIIAELTAYLHLCFGHPVRLDYGTGHESSFMVLLFCLCKIGCFGEDRTKSALPPPALLAPVALSVLSQYLQVTRGIQSDYMLEPAGSHGVWGLDDYHCLPFYFGACQLRNNVEEYGPDCIQDDGILEAKGDEYMYLGCIRYVKFLKKSAPFFETSPMLNDISRLATWNKVSGGLLRLYEGEVLDKRPVVQHFVFGNIFKATWIASEAPVAPTRTFINGPGGEECIAPWAQNNVSETRSRPRTPPSPELGPGTRAPWATAPRPPGSPSQTGGGMPPSTRAPWAK